MAVPVAAPTAAATVAPTAAPTAAPGAAPTAKRSIGSSATSSVDCGVYGSADNSAGRDASGGADSDGSGVVLEVADGHLRPGGYDALRHGGGVAADDPTGMGTPRGRRPTAAVVYEKRRSGGARPSNNKRSRGRTSSCRMEAAARRC